MFQMHQGAADVIHLERAPDAPLGPVRAEHEVLDDKLAAAGEQVAERPRTVRRVEHVGLLYLDPWQREALGVQFVAHAGERLLLGQQLLARGKPLIARNDLVLHGWILLSLDRQLLSTRARRIGSGFYAVVSMYSAKRSMQLVQPLWWLSRSGTSSKPVWRRVSNVWGPCGSRVRVTSISWPGLPSASSHA